MSLPSTAPSAAPNRTRNLIIGAVALILVVIVIVVIALQLLSPNKNTVVQASVQGACRAAYEEAFLKSGALTEAQFTQACEKEAQEMTTTYPVAVERCYGQFPEQPYQLLECLTAEGAAFSGTHMLTART